MSQRSRACLPRKRGLGFLPRPATTGHEFEEVFVRWQAVLASVLAVYLFGGGSAQAQISDNVVKIGVMNDQSGLYADLGGPGSGIAARIAAEEGRGAGPRQTVALR